MGQNASLPKGRRKSLKTVSRKWQTKGCNLSHTFTLNESQEKMELLNINIASEEELMTLPGISRELAKNITEHRKAIIRFRKVEDLALVKGIGAEKLEAIKPEICVNTRRAPSCASSRAQSYDSLKSSDSKYTIKSSRIINVNEASVFELQGVHGISQEIAAAIVHYRGKRGPFKKLDDLLKVKGINRIRLNNISHYLSVNLNEIENDDDNNKASIITNGVNGFNHSLKAPPPKLPVKNGLPLSSLTDIFELLTAYSPRPIVEEVFDYTRNGEPALRAAAWNLHNFSYEKASNLGVKEVICRTILENGWSIVAVQEVLDVAALRAICEELNKPQLRRVAEWKQKSRSWNFCMLDKDDSQVGFLYDSDGVIDLELISVNDGPNDETSDFCDVIIGVFRIGNLDLQLVNLKLKKITNLALLHNKVQDLVNEDDRVMVFVDFSNYTLNTDDCLNLGGLNSVFPATISTNVLSSNTEILSNNQTCNVLCNTQLNEQLTGIKGVVRKGLTHLGIPNGWHWGGTASPYSPIWVELFQHIVNGTTL